MAASGKVMEVPAIDLGSLLDAGDGAMVIMVAGNTQLAVHRDVLAARSPVFAAMFQHDTLEARSGQVVIPDMEGAVLRQMLAYSYTLQAPQLPDMAAQLLVAADKYGLLALKTHCEHQVAAQLTVETAAATAVLALRHSCTSLWEAAAAVMRAHASQVLMTQGWADALLGSPDLSVELTNLIREPLEEASATAGPAAADAGTKSRRQHRSRPNSSHGETSVMPTPPCHTPPPEGGTASHIRCFLKLSRRFLSTLFVQKESSMIAANSKVEEAVAVDLGTLLDMGEGALVTLVAGGTRLAVHRAILAARGVVLEAMFHLDTLEASSSQIDIPDMEGPVLRQLLAYCYSLHVPQLPSMAAKLLVVADKYCLLGLKAQCEQTISEHLTVENAADMAVLAVRHSCHSLRQAVATFMKGYTSLVLKTQSWAAALVSNPDQDVELTSLIAKPPAKLRRLASEEKGRRLRQAAEKGRLEEVEALLAAGSDVGARDEYWRTALHHAAWEGHVEVARRLVGGGAEVDARDILQGTTLHYAAIRGHAAVVRLLLASSADPNARDVRGHTSMHYAAFFGHPETAAALLDVGADTGAMTIAGYTPLDCARKANQLHMIQLLT